MHPRWEVFGRTSEHSDWMTRHRMVYVERWWIVTTFYELQRKFGTAPLSLLQSTTDGDHPSDISGVRLESPPDANF